MALIYVSTCAGGFHHTYQDDETGDVVVFTTDQLEQSQLDAEATRQKSDDLFASLPDQISQAISTARAKLIK